MKLLNLSLILLAVALALYVVFGTSILRGFARAGNTEEYAAGKELSEKALTQLGTIQDRRLTEISGIDTSLKYLDCFWVHNDSGNPAELFLISKTGHTLARVKLTGARNVDWEDISVCKLYGQPFIVIADVGDNVGQRKNCQLYLLPEPDLAVDLEAMGTAGRRGKAEPEIVEHETEDFTKLDFQYQGGPRNCEAMAIYAHQGRIILFEKAKNNGDSKSEIGIFELRLWKDKLAFLSPKARKTGRVAERLITGADMNASGKSLLTCNYALGARYNRRLAETWERHFAAQQFSRFSLPVQRQGEAICFSADGKSAIVVSEFGRQPIWQVDLETAIKAKKASGSAPN